MPLNPIYDKWSKNKYLEKSFSKALLNFRNTNTRNQIEKAFTESIQFINNKIISNIGVGTNLINEYTITAIAYAFVKHIINKKDKKELKVFIATDDSFYANLYLNIFARVFTENNIKTVIFLNSANNPLTFKNLASTNSECDAIITLQKYFGQTKTMQISFNDGDGAPFSNLDVRKIGWTIKTTNYLALNIPEKEISFSYDSSIKDYIKKINDRYHKNKFLTKNSVNFGVDISNVKNKDFYLSNFAFLNLSFFYINRKKDKNTFFANGQESLSRVYWKGLFQKSKANFVINQDGTGLNLCIKHKKIFKYFKPDEIAALYLNYLIEHDEEFDKNDLKSGYIALNHYASSLTKKIAMAHGLEIVNFNNRSNLWEVIKEHKNKKLLFAFNKNGEYVPYNRFFNGYDANLFLLEVLKMINYYEKEHKKDLFTVLQEIYNKIGKHQLTVHTYNIDQAITNRFFQRLKSISKIDNKYDVVRIQEISNASEYNVLAIYKLFFRNEDSVTIEYSQLTNKIRFYCETIEQKNEENSELMMVVRNKEILEGILELKEEGKNSKLTFLSLFKYLLYLGIFIGIILFLFHSVYNLKGNGVGGSVKEVFEAIHKKLYVKHDIAQYQRSLSQGYFIRTTFTTLCLSFLLFSAIQSLIFKRLLTIQGHKVSWKDLYIGNAISLVVQTITPKSIGGDLATYWYLRRKNISRPVLLSAIIVNTFLWQTSNVLITLTMMPVGIWMFDGFFKQGTPESITFIVMLVFGMIIDTSLSVLMLLVSINKKIQKIFVRLTMFLIEWIPFIKSYDSVAIEAKYKYELYNINICLKKTFSNIGYFFELLFYKTLPAFFTFSAFFGQSINIIQPNIIGGYYMNITVQNILIRIANSISITPGGTGTADVLYNFLIRESLQNTSYDGNGYIANAAIMTAMNTLGTVIIPSAISGTLLILVYVGEKRTDFYNQKIKNLKLLNNNNLLSGIKTKSNYSKIAFPIFWSLLFLITILFIFIG